MTEKILRRFDIYTRIIQHGRVSVPQLMRRKRFNRYDLRIAAACIPSACLDKWFCLVGCCDGV